MDKLFETLIGGYTGYWSYLTGEMFNLGWHNYFWWLVGLSLFVWILEIFFPWRKDQSLFRKDFWLDGFYMFFNFFLFSLIGYNALSNIVVELFSNLLAAAGIRNLIALNISGWPGWAQMLFLFVVADFLQWNIHRLLHHVPWLWTFHKVHHSVEEMGFAAHLRYHWMETIVYKSIQYIPLAMIGFGLKDFFIVHIFSVAIGHFNHANLNISWGPLRYILNSPGMHIWHHAKNLPEGRTGVNYGISLSLWDYLFGTAWIPYSGRDEKLGFEGVENFPSTFVDQVTYPFKKEKK
ncbi:MAG: sterol desaturase family protein [Cyclobacteriaceae bacterium]